MPLEITLPRADGAVAELTLRCEQLHDAWVVLLVEGSSDDAIAKFTTQHDAHSSSGVAPTYLGRIVSASEAATVSLRGRPGSTHRILVLAFPLLVGDDRRRLDRIYEHVRAAAAALARGDDDDARVATAAALEEATDLLAATASHEVLLPIERLCDLPIAAPAREAVNRFLLSFWTSRVPAGHFVRTSVEAALATAAADRGEVERAVASYRALLAAAVEAGSTRSWKAREVRCSLLTTLARHGDFEGAMTVSRELLSNWYGTATATDEAWVRQKCDHVWLSMQVGEMEAALVEGEQLERMLADANLMSTPPHVRLLAHLVDIGLALNDTERAARFARAMVDATERGAPDDASAVVDALMHLADVLIETGADAQAVEIASKACALARDLEPADFMAQWPRLALAEALPVARNTEAIELANAVLDSPHCANPDTQAAVYARLVLGKRYGLVGDAERAMGCAELALASCERKPAANHEYAQWARTELMLAHFDLGETSKARDILLAESVRFEQRLLGLLGVVDARSVEGARETMLQLVHWLLSVDEKPDAAVAAAQLYTVLRLRGLTERRARLARVVAAAAARDPEIAKVWRNARNGANAVQRAREEDVEEATLHMLEDRTRAADDDLARRVHELPEAEAVLAPSRLTELLAPLGPTDALLLPSQYTRFLPFDRQKGQRGPSESRFALFAAWNRDGVTTVVRFELGAAKTLIEACEASVKRCAAGGRGRPADEVRGSAPDVLGTALGPAIDALPADTRTLWICPEGALAAVPWDLVPIVTAGKPPQMLADRFCVRYVESPMAFRRPAARVGAPCLLVFGGIDYGTAEPAPAADRKSEPVEPIAGHAWPALPGSDREAEIAAAAFAAAFPSDRLVRRRGGAATKNEFTAHAAEATTIHLACHAFVTERRRHAHRLLSVGLAPSDDPESTAYLVLAGANGDRDALLSEHDLEWLDLARCQLAVLSACSTNVGVRRSGEAMSGLNRAAQLAGARNTIASLWPVSDAGAADFFARFYTSLWRDGASVAEAFAAARAELRKRYGPEVWAAFVLYETGSSQ
ncbi:MAG TPA: CHAT domain-containing protein [Planctomycetota bacterium]|nr:CHAT domain-containing protein [Planctomycetota bacterium]